MSADSDRRKLAAQWQARADADLKSARQLAAYGADADPGAICFHAQQAVEKYLKALLILCGASPTRTHDVTALAEALPDIIQAEMDLDALDALADYAVTVRYPGPFEEPSIEDARSAVVIAERVAATAARHSHGMDDAQER